MFTILQQEVDVRLLVWIIIYLKAINVLSRLFCRTYIIIDEILVLCIISICSLCSCIDDSIDRFIEPLLIFRNLKNKEMK